MVISHRLWNVPLQIVADGSRTFEIIGDLQPYSLYEMRVIAVAELGASQPSYSVDIAPIGL